MQSNPAVCLTALALLLAPAMASAADVSAARSSGQAMTPAEGGSSSSGLSALKSSNAGSSLRGSAGEASALRSTSGAFARPSGSSWSDGFQALAAAQPSALMTSKGAESAMMPPHGASNINGLDAIKRATPSSQPRATAESVQSTAGANLSQTPR